MDTLLLVIIAVLLLLLAGMAVIVARVFLYERRRSEARVAALGAMAVESGALDWEQATEPDAMDAAGLDSAGPNHAAPSVQQEPALTAPAAPAARILEPDLELRRDEPDRMDAPLFAQPERPSPWGRRVAIIVPLALIVVAAGTAFYPSDPEIGAVAPAPPPAAEQISSIAPLELLSLRHTQNAESLAVSGLVQNPRTATVVSQVYATAFLFAADGTFLASGRAPLDFTTLGPGDESPFVVTIPVKGAVARYRIGFRGADGRVIAHIDRRASGAIARVSEDRR